MKIPTFLIPIIASIIIFSWFSEGKIISNNSEEDLSIYNSQNLAENSSSFWYPSGTGLKMVLRMPTYPTSTVLGFLESNGIPAFLRQAILLGTLMAVGMLTMYILLRNGLRMNYPVSFIGSLFYLLNIYSMTQIWKRFLYERMFVWAYAPLFVFLWIKWIDGKRLIWLPFFLLSFLIFTYSFAFSPSHLITIWSIAAIFTLTALWSKRRNIRDLFKILLKSLIGFILWGVVNAWWFYPMLTLGSSWTGETGQTWQGDFNSLLGVSKYFPLWDVLLLRQNWYLGPENDWVFYQNPLVYLLSIMILILAIYGAIKIKHQYKKFLVILAVIGLFISKGTNFPFGHTFFYLLFSNIPFTTALRNSYEKFGLVLLIPYTVFFAYGLYYFLLRFKKRLRYLYGGLIIFFSCGLLVYPIWNGDIFPPKHRLNVPAYYLQANEYLKTVSSNRIFLIPFTTAIEKIRYKWGYEGEDPAENLFEFQIVSKAKLPVFKNYYELIPQYLENKDFPKVLALLGVDRIILRKDIVYPDPIPTSLQSVETLDSVTGVTKEREIGELIIYKIDKDLVKPVVYVTQLTTVKSLKDGLDKVISGEIDIKKVGFSYDNSSPNSPEGDSPRISYTKLANDRYNIKIENATESFYLILNNTYDKLWQAKIAGDIIEKHFIVNGFANGWSVDKKGTYDIDIFFKVWPWDE